MHLRFLLSRVRLDEQQLLRMLPAAEGNIGCCVLADAGEEIVVSEAAEEGA